MTASTGRPDRATILAFLSVAVLGGLNAIAVKVSVRELAPYWSAGSRFVVAGAILAIVVLLSRRSFPRGRSLLGAAAYGSVGLAASFGLVYPALREVPAGTAMVFIALVPLETYVLAILHRQERFHLQGLAGALISVMGVLIVVWDQLSAAVPLGSMLAILAGTVFIAEAAVLLKAIPKADPYSTNAVAMLTAGGLLTGISALAGEPWVLPGEPVTWLAMAYLVVFGSIALFGLYLFALRRWTASAVSYTTLLMPLVTVPVAALLISEPITLAFLAGAGVALLGTYLGAFRPRRPARSTATAAPECLPIEDCLPIPAVAVKGISARRTD